MGLFDFLQPKNFHNDITSHNNIPHIQSLEDLKIKVINNTAQALSNKCIIKFSKDINKPLSEFGLHLHFSMENYITEDELKSLIRKFAPEGQGIDYSRNSEIQEKVLDKASRNIIHVFREKGYNAERGRPNKGRPAIIITEAKK